MPSNKSRLTARVAQLSEEMGIPAPRLTRGQPGRGRDGLYFKGSIIVSRWDEALVWHEFAHHVAIVCHEVGGHSYVWQSIYANLLTYEAGMDRRRAEGQAAFEAADCIAQQGR